MLIIVEFTHYTPREPVPDTLSPTSAPEEAASQAVVYTERPQTQASLASQQQVEEASGSKPSSTSKVCAS